MRKPNIEDDIREFIAQESEEFGFDPTNCTELQLNVLVANFLEFGFDFYGLDLNDVLSDLLTPFIDAICAEVES
jgi:hypothetical protein